MKAFSITVVAVSALFFASCSNTDTTVNEEELKDTLDHPMTGYDSIGMKADTVSFLVEAAKGGMAEVHAGNTGKSQATNPRVKKYADMLVKDHSAANEKVKILAASKNVVLPTTVDDMHKQMMAETSEKKGNDFDKAFMQQMVKDHEEDIRKFEDAQGKEQDSAIITFIKGTLPVLRKHLDSANAIVRDLK